MTINLFDLAKTGRYESAELAADGHSTVKVAPLKWGEQKTQIGSVKDVSNILLEDGKSHANTIHMHPMWVSNGSIKGWLPWKKLPKYAVFKAQIGFMQGAKGTDGVTFWIWEHHKEGGREVWNPVLKSHKKYTGKLLNVEVDLSQFSNQNVAIELRVDAGKSSGQDWAVWVNPRIEMNPYIPSDVKIDGTTLTLEGNVINASAHDFVLDHFSRRKSTSGVRRALVHGFSDELVVNYRGDYPGGTIVHGYLQIADKQKNARIYINPQNGNIALGGKGQDGDLFLTDKNDKTRVTLDTSKFNAAPWPKWEGESRATSNLDLISEIRRLKQELLDLKSEVAELKKSRTGLI